MKKLDQTLMIFEDNNYHFPVLFEVYVRVSLHGPVKQGSGSISNFNNKKFKQGSGSIGNLMNK